VNIQELREYRERLERALNYCPTGSVPIAVFDRAQEAAFRADEQMHHMLPTFALLDAIDILAARLDKLERMENRFQAWVALSPSNAEYNAYLTSKEDTP